MANKNCLLCGVGGQGTVLASKLIAAAAMSRGQQARTAETIGMAQRGGCVVSHVRIGDIVHSPLIPFGDADVIIGFEPAEAVRCFNYLKHDGVVIVNKKPVRPVTASLSGSDYDGKECIEFLQNNSKRIIIIDSDIIVNACGSPKALNVGLLGAAVASGFLSITLEEMEETIKQRVSECFLNMNLKALYAGAEFANFK